MRPFPCLLALALWLPASAFAQTVLSFETAATPKQFDTIRANVGDLIERLTEDEREMAVMDGRPPDPVDASVFMVETFDLNGDGHPELLFRASTKAECMSSGCPTYLLMGTARGHAPPAEPGFPHSIGNSFEPATILASKTNGFHDIHMEGRGFEHRRTWDGAHYQQR